MLCKGETSEKKVPFYKQVALVHLLVTARDLLLKCDLSTALDYLGRAKETNMDASLGKLWAKLRVVQYLSQRNKEPNAKIAELKQWMKAWVQKNRTQRPCPKPLSYHRCPRFSCVSWGEQQQAGQLESERVVRATVCAHISFAFS
ncbi:hypothetical protein SKAU_G00019220 [Synaphobranchus kaupii]|uniref:Uncharacterized protein n=1 Tax=Synaphobranchus kaupii TaxID=118154 RepID=A0A9Q1GCU6_SYNKA|nr:hypothetical protein SKAU_G00019220 [Synaphobranchus kaupii]